MQGIIYDPASYFNIFNDSYLPPPVVLKKNLVNVDLASLTKEVYCKPIVIF